MEPDLRRLNPVTLLTEENLRQHTSATSSASTSTISLSFRGTHSSGSTVGLQRRAASSQTSAVYSEDAFERASTFSAARNDFLSESKRRDCTQQSDLQIRRLRRTITQAAGENALHGLRRWTAYGAVTAALTMIFLAPALALAPLSLPLGPIISSGILLSCIVLGALIQVVSRWRNIAKVSPEDIAQLEAIVLQLKQTAPMDPDPAHTTQIKEAQTLLGDVRGGIPHNFKQFLDGFFDCYSHVKLRLKFKFGYRPQIKLRRTVVLG